MITEAMVRPPNSLVLVGDPAGELPDSMKGGLVEATSTCVAVGTLAEADGMTTIRLIEAGHAADVPPHLVFDGVLEIPSKRLRVASVLDDAYLERPVDRSLVPLQIWANDLDEPDNICVVLIGGK